VNWSAVTTLDVLIELVTVTLIVPTEPAGEVAVIDVADTTAIPIAAVPPKLTAAPVVVKFVPLIVTDVPPVLGPVFGLTPVTVGLADAE
jgi:hypothetical protein